MAVRSTFLGIEVSKRGLAVSQKGLDITSNNVANINTPGYTRQRVDISSVSVSGNYRYPTGSVDNSGAGSQIDGIAQIRNKFLDVRFRDSNANTGYYEQQVSILTGVQNAIDEISSDGLLTVYQEALAAIQNLSMNPNDAVYAATAKSAINNVNLILQQFDKSLRDVAEQQIYDTSVIIDSANTCLDKIATINKALLLESNNELSNVYSSNELNDQLNLLIDELSSYANIDVTWESDTTATISINGHVVVQGAWCDKMQLNKNSNSTIEVIYKSTGEQVSLSGGAIKANSDHDLLAHTNEFNFVSPGYNGDIYINYRTASGSDGNISNYRFYNGKGTALANIYATTFYGALSGNATTATGFASAKTIALTGNVTGSATGGNGSNGWSIATTVASVPNAALPRRIQNYSTAGYDDANDATEQGFHYMTTTATNRPSFVGNTTNKDYRILTTAYSSSWV